jgi:hypothetical protein
MFVTEAGVARGVQPMTDIMEIAIAVIVLAVGLMLERSRGREEPIRVRSDRVR